MIVLTASVGARFLPCPLYDSDRLTFNMNLEAEDGSRGEELPAPELSANMDVS